MFALASADHHLPQTHHHHLPQTRIGSRVITRTENLREFVPRWIQKGVKEVEQHVPIITYDTVPYHTTRRVPKVVYELKKITRTVKVPRISYKEMSSYNTVIIPKVGFQTLKTKVEQQVPTVSFETVNQSKTEFVPTVDTDYVTVTDYRHEPQLSYTPIEKEVTRDRIRYNPKQRTVSVKTQRVWPEIDY